MNNTNHRRRRKQDASEKTNDGRDSLLDVKYNAYRMVSRVESFQHKKELASQGRFEKMFPNKRKPFPETGPLHSQFSSLLVESYCESLMIYLAAFVEYARSQFSETRESIDIIRHIAFRIEIARK